MFPELSTLQDEYLRRFPNFSRPQPVGFLSLDGTRRLHHDTSQLKFLRKSEERLVSFDLNRDIDRAVRKDNRNEKISHLLQYILEQERRLHSLLNEGPSLKQSRFVCYRGLLTCVANTPYEGQEGWRIVATLHRGHIFMCTLETQEAKERKQQLTERDQQFTAWGYKFEQYVLSDTPTSSPDVSSPLNENEEFSLVFNTQLNEHRLLYVAEMDGILADEAKDTPPATSAGPDNIMHYLLNKKFVELKTNRHIEFPKQDTNFRRFKMRKWWCQSFLAGVDTILCGLRDDNGLVDRVQLYRVADLPRMCSRFWNPDVCFNFLETFLTFVKRCLAREVTRRHGEARLRQVTSVPTTALHFEWSPRQRVRVTDNYDHQTDPQRSLAEVAEHLLKLIPGMCKDNVIGETKITEKLHIDTHFLPLKICTKAKLDLVPHRNGRSMATTIAVVWSQCCAGIPTAIAAV